MQLDQYCPPRLRATVVCLSACAALAIAGCGATGTGAGSVQRKVSTVSVTPAMVSLALAATEQFVATATYSDGSSSDVTSTATWSSSNPAIATINSAGLATSVAVGSTSITASLNSANALTTLRNL